MASVGVANLFKSFGLVDVIRDVNIDISDGEFVILVGPSGCGKSTLLRMIAGLEHVNEGDILIDGKVVSHVPPKDRNIAMVFQNYALYPHMTVRENMGFSLKLRGSSKAEIEEGVASAANILDLTKLLDRFPKQLSGGQRQRVAMGRAIVRNPQVFLFDEPLSNLDAKLRVQMRTEIKALHQRLKTTIIYVTHDQIEAMTMADKIVVMNGGVVEQVGAPLDLYDRPDNRFVAGFIGSPAMNFLNGRIEGNAFVTEAGRRFAIPTLPGHDTGLSVEMGVRPEHLHISADGIPANVVVTEPTGSETMVVVDLDGKELTCLFRDRIVVQPGEVLNIDVRPEHIHLFDTQTGRRLG